MPDIVIKSFCSINSLSVSINGIETPFPGDFASGIRELYRSNNISYPKFFKMDDLSKLAFISTELALKDQDRENAEKNSKTGVILMTSESSLDTDCRFSESINTVDSYYPSPAVFVYTLPNIMAGEICIRNSFRGENCIYISSSCDWEFITDYVRSLIEAGKIDACICGWCNYFKDDFSSTIIYAGKTGYMDEVEPFTCENIMKLVK